MINESAIQTDQTSNGKIKQLATLHRVQEALGNMLKTTVVITDPENNYITVPYLLPPFIKPGAGNAALWSCCRESINHLVNGNDVTSTETLCECGHHINSFKIQLDDKLAIRLATVRVTDKFSKKDLLITGARKNSYSDLEALLAFDKIETSNDEEFKIATSLIYHNTLLFNALIEDYREQNRTNDDEDRRLTEQELIKAKNEAEESSRLKSSLLANMSHELRTPMTGILGFSEILHDELEDNRLKSMASTIYKSANRLMTTLNSIMDLSVLESNRTDLKLRSVNVKNTFMGLLRNAYNIANDKGLYIRTALPPNINVQADEKLLGQMLHHLLDNAIKFTLDGGISISAYSGLRETSDVVIKISDTGIGIAPQHHKLIFEEFRQVSEGLSRTFEGSGLGLSLVMKIARLLNARVWVESVPDKGSDFFVALPSAGIILEPQVIVEEHEEIIKTVRLGKGNVPEVLIVEDNEINRRLAALYLRELCNIDMAENGYVAMTKIRSKKYDAVLMDINLGAGPNGIHVAHEIRGIEAYKDVPIIAVTGYTMQGDREKLLANGCTHYVAKPYDKKTLIKLFSGLLYK